MDYVDQAVADIQRLLNKAKAELKAQLSADSHTYEVNAAINDALQITEVLKSVHHGK